MPSPIARRMFRTPRSTDTISKSSNGCHLAGDCFDCPFPRCMMLDTSPAEQIAISYAVLAYAARTRAGTVEAEARRLGITPRTLLRARSEAAGRLATVGTDLRPLGAFLIRGKP